VEPEFAADARQDGRIWVVRVAGEVDIATAPRLDATFESIVASEPSRVLLELEDVTFLDSSGIRSLVLAQRHLEEAGAVFVIDGMSDAVMHVLEIAGVLESLAHPEST